MFSRKIKKIIKSLEEFINGVDIEKLNIEKDNINNLIKIENELKTYNLKLIEDKFNLNNIELNSYDKIINDDSVLK